MKEKLKFVHKKKEKQTEKLLLDLQNNLSRYLITDPDKFVGIFFVKILCFSLK